MTEHEAQQLGTELMRIGSILRLNPGKVELPHLALTTLMLGCNISNQDRESIQPHFPVLLEKCKTEHEDHEARDIQGNTAAIFRGPPTYLLTIKSFNP